MANKMLPISYEIVLGKRKLFGLLGRKKHGILRNRSRTYHTKVMGHEVSVASPDHRKADLFPDGRLVAYYGYCWDFASGAVDTPDMVDASLCHDVLCDMIVRKMLPKEAQSVADLDFRERLKHNGTGSIRRWYSYLAVRGYQTLKGRY